MATVAFYYIFADFFDVPLSCSGKSDTVLLFVNLFNVWLCRKWLLIFAFAFHLLNIALLVKVHEENLASLRYISKWR